MIGIVGFAGGSADPSPGEQKHNRQDAERNPHLFIGHAEKSFASANGNRAEPIRRFEKAKETVYLTTTTRGNIKNRGLICRRGSKPQIGGH
jgi:hypothetical protein